MLLQLQLKSDFIIGIYYIFLKAVPYWKGRNVNGQWVEMPLQGNELKFMIEERKE